MLFTLFGRFVSSVAYGTVAWTWAVELIVGGRNIVVRKIDEKCKHEFVKS